ncbi:MAG TPA: DNA-binding protein [Brevundimonas sp.]|uniref:helix-turn-helix transcriptional regulator n=1 Tax=unclassified Brevundimonas TaxID=2622653 RepID=UPI000E93ABF4|nr:MULTISPECIES: helix-turn-helix domain-containing protein [unclassified Brevundimonas]HBI19051.1 DNA-binding protein [Brevundimonas sp.]
MAETRDLMNRFVRTPEAGRLLGLSGRTLEKHRTSGTGPIYRKLGGRVVYSVTDLRAWADTDVRTSTTQSAKPVPNVSGEADARAAL